MRGVDVGTSRDPGVGRQSWYATSQRFSSSPTVRNAAAGAPLGPHGRVSMCRGSALSAEPHGRRGSAVACAPRPDRHPQRQGSPIRQDCARAWCSFRSRLPTPRAQSRDECRDTTRIPDRAGCPFCSPTLDLRGEPFLGHDPKRCCSPFPDWSLVIASLPRHAESQRQRLTNFSCHSSPPQLSPYGSFVPAQLPHDVRVG